MDEIATALGVSKRMVTRYLARIIHEKAQPTFRELL